MNIINIEKRLKALETSGFDQTPCFCTKTFIALVYGSNPVSGITFCPRCKSKYEFWEALAVEAASSENLTDLL